MIRKVFLAILFLAPFALVSAFGSAAKIYITQNGSPSGNCTASVQTPSFVTTAGNWGSGATQIGPGTTVLFCGTFTLPVGASLASFLGSGTPGNAVVFKLDANAVIQSGAMGSDSAGAVNCSDQSYVTVDGGTSGIIQNTANGTGLANSRASQGLYFSGCRNVVVTNLTIQKIYTNLGSQSGASDSNGVNTADVHFVGNSTNSEVSNSTLNNARTGILIDFDSGADASHFLVYGNTISDHAWHVAIGADNAGSTATGIAIYDNQISDWTNWQYPSSTYHTDGIILYNDITTGAFDTYKIYNNYFSGSLGGGSPTGYIACGLMSTCTIFNNLMVDTGSHACWGYIWLYSPNGPDSVYNNTLVGSSSSPGAAVALGDPGPGPGPTRSALTVKNNIFINVNYALRDYQTLTSDVAASDNNVFRTPSGGAPNMATSDSTTISYSTWQSHGFDANSSASDPKLSGTYYPQSGSSAIGLGANLINLGDAALNMDKASAPRPVSGAWDGGVYISNSSSTPPPSGLTAVVK